MDVRIKGLPALGFRKARIAGFCVFRPHHRRRVHSVSHLFRPVFPEFTPATRFLVAHQRHASWDMSPGGTVDEGCWVGQASAMPNRPKIFQ